MENERIKCEICGAECHSIQLHLSEKHNGVTIAQYQKEYRNAPILSEVAKKRIAEARAKQSTEPARPKRISLSRNFHELFGIASDVPEAMTASGYPIPITVLEKGEWQDFVPTADENHVYDVEVTKNCLMALELNIPLYLFGHTGTGKTTTLENICALTNRPFIRVQHTVNTEENNVTGNWIIKGKETVFELGPLPLAMKNGWVYLADEYDFALPSVLAVYQPVLEGKALVIKEADAENRIIKPHPNFRFVATGNTNGVGDETGLYQGTAIQNAANYDRFNMVVEVGYMRTEQEVEMLVKQADISEDDAKKLVQFAGSVRDEFAGSRLGTPISPRTLIAIAKIGFLKNSYKKGIQLAFSNKLSQTDREAVNGFAQRIFG